MTENYIDCTENNSGSEILNSPECEKIKSLILPHLINKAEEDIFIDYLNNWAGLFTEEEIKAYVSGLDFMQRLANTYLRGYVAAFCAVGLISDLEQIYCSNFFMNRPHIEKKYAA